MICLKIRKHHPGFSLDVAVQWDETLIGIWGPSGSGKTTLLECLAGLQQPDEGEIVFDKQCLFSSRRRIHVPLAKRGIGMVLQHDELFEHLSVRDNVFFGCRPDAPRSLIDDVVGSLRLETLMDKRVPALSGGQRQRVAWARALLAQPRCLLLDEPLSALHVSARYEILMMLRRMVQRYGFSVVMVSHLMDELSMVCTVIGVMNGGCLVAQGRPDQIGHHPGVLREWGVSAPWPKNVYEAEAVDCDGVMGLRLGDTVLHTAVRAPWPRPTRVCAAIRPVDVIIAKKRPAHISARNIFPITLTGLYGREDAVLLEGVFGSAHMIRAVVTVQSAAEMDLKKDDSVFAIIKAHDIDVLYPQVYPG